MAVTEHYHLSKPSSNDAVDITVINSNMDTLDNVIYQNSDSSNILQLVYPVGAIYISTKSTSPATLFGFGTWQRIGAGRTLIDSGTGYTAGSTGGSANAIVPYHRHSVSAVTNAITGGSHNHDIDTNGGGGTSPHTASGVDYTYGSNTRRFSTFNYSSTHKHDLPAHNTNYAGSSGNATGANMPPYLAVYMWKRTA